MNLELPEEICDAHVHIGEYFPVIDLSFKIDNLVRLMNKYRIESALIFSGRVDPHKETNKILKALKSERSLYALLRSNPQNYVEPSYLRWMEDTIMGDDRVVGMKINPSTEKHRATDEIYRRPLEVLQDCGAVLLVHCGRWVEMSGWMYAIKAAKRYPRVRFILAHMGGTHPDLAFPAIEAASSLPNVYMDTSQTRQTAVILKGIKTLGASRILFGSDLPWGSYLQNLVGILELDLSESDLNNILRENFYRLTER